MTPKPLKGMEIVTNPEAIIRRSWKRWYPLLNQWEPNCTWGHKVSSFPGEIYSRPVKPTTEDRLKLLESGFDNHEDRLRELQEVNSVSLTDTLVNAIIDNCAGCNGIFAVWASEETLRTRFTAIISKTLEELDD